MGQSATSPMPRQLEDGWIIAHRSLNRALEGFQSALARANPGVDDHIYRLHKWFPHYVEHLVDHHDAEEQIFFPALRQKVQELPPKISADHKELMELVSSISGQLDELIMAEKTDRPAKLANVKESIARLDALSKEHFQEEEVGALPLYKQHISKQDHKVLEKRLRRRGTMKQRKARLVHHLQGFQTEEDLAYFLTLFPWIMRMMAKSWKKNYDKSVESLLDGIK